MVDLDSTVELDGEYYSVESVYYLNGVLVARARSLEEEEVKVVDASMLEEVTYAIWA